VGLGSGAVLLVAIILGATGAFSGDGSSEGTTTTTTTPNAGEELTRVKLEPQSGAGGSGTAIVGLAGGSQPYVDVTLDGLEPPPQGQTYVIWLLLTPNQGYPLAPVASCSSAVPPPCLQNGGYQDRIAIQSPLITVLTRVQFVDVSIAPIDTITKAIRAAFDKQHIVLKRPGTSVLRGAIPKSGGGAAR
jgi:hypothetical protein